MKNTLFICAIMFCLLASRNSYAAEHLEHNPNISGGYAFRQYVTVEPDGKTILAAKGIIYISQQPFSATDIEKIKNAEYGDIALSAGHHWVQKGLANVCAAIVPVNLNQGILFNYLPLVITRARNNNSGVKLTLRTFPDAWFGWNIRKSENSIAINPFPSNSNQWGWTSKRFEVTNKPSLNFKECLKYSQSHIKDVQKAIRQVMHKIP